jgi:hypothetical protein
MALAQLIKAWDGAGRAQFVAAFAEPSAISFSSPLDRGTLDIPNCSYTDGLFTFRNRWDQSHGTNGARFLYAKISGVLGLTPQFRMLIDNLDGVTSPSSRFAFSYDNTTWERFTNRGSTSTYFSFSNSTPFTQNDVFVAIWPAWPVGRTSKWIPGLAASGYVGQTPSTTDFIFNTRSATVNELGATIAANHLYAFKVSAPGSTAPDGAPKRNMVLMAGVHASEDVGNFCLKGAVEFLVSEDPQAATIRSWFSVFVYPLVATAGRMGGSGRSDFQAGYMRTDVNREWDSSVMETLVKHKAAILADTGGEVAVFMDFHGTTAQEYRYDYTDSRIDHSAWMAAVRTFIPGLVQTQSSIAGSSITWATDTFSPSISIIHENPYIRGGIITQAYIEQGGADHMRAVALLASQGYFGENLEVEGAVNAIDEALDFAIVEAVVSDAGSQVIVTMMG